MSDKNVQILARVIGVLWILWGLLTSFGAALVLFATGVVGYGEALAAQLGKEVGDFPYSAAVVGSVSIVLLGILYFVGAFALLTFKKWAYIPVALVAAVGIISNIALLVLVGGLSIAEVVWSIVYLGFAYLIYTKKEVFKN